MRSCYGCSEGGSVTWSDLFTKVVDATPAKLNNWQILPVDVSIEGYGRDGPAETLKQIHDIMSKNHRKRLFSYAYLDDKYGFVFEDLDVVVNLFLLGHDQASWVRLQNIIAENRRRLVRR
jgi:hypothetical protein